MGNNNAKMNGEEPDILMDEKFDIISIGDDVPTNTVINESADLTLKFGKFAEEGTTVFNQLIDVFNRTIH